MYCEQGIKPYRKEPLEYQCVKCKQRWFEGNPAPNCAAMQPVTVTEEAKPASVPAADLLPGEPFFTLRASDLLAPYLVERWAAAAEAHGCDPKKVRAARETALEMSGWGGVRGYPA
jgi:hypothetical protein